MKELIEPNTAGPLREEPCTVVIIYEDRLSRDHAMEVCDHLVGLFWTEVEFDFRWWRMDFLADAELVRAAGDDVAKADIIIFSSAPALALSTATVRWFSGLVSSRNGREGVLLHLTCASGTESPHQPRMQATLRELASRAALEYLAELPPGLGEPRHESFESAKARSPQISSVLEAMLNSPPPPPHFGLND